MSNCTGRHRAAEALFRQALGVLEEGLGPGHELTAFTRANYADFLLATNRAAEALPAAKQALAELRNRLSAGHRYVRWARDVFRRARQDGKGAPRTRRKPEARG